MKSISKREKVIRELLKEKWPNEEVLYNYRPDWLVNPKTGYNLELDIYYPNLKLAVEVQGLHHQLIEQEFKDGIKDKECFKRGIMLEKVLMKEKSFRKFILRHGLRESNFRFQARTPRRGSSTWPYYEKTFRQLKKEIWVRRLNLYNEMQNAEIKGNLERRRAKGLASLAPSH